jgi:hypothetical protein
MIKKDWETAPGNENNHYEGTIQPTEFIEGRDLSFIEGNVVKYLSRHKKKAGKLDLEKALWYIGRILDKADGKDLEESHSTQEFIKSQGFSPLEGEIMTKLVRYYATRNTSDLYTVQVLIKTLIEREYGSDD